MPITSNEFNPTHLSMNAIRVTGNQVGACIHFIFRSAKKLKPCVFCYSTAIVLSNCHWTLGRSEIKLHGRELNALSYKFGVILFDRFTLTLRPSRNIRSVLERERSEIKNILRNISSDNLQSWIDNYYSAFSYTGERLISPAPATVSIFLLLPPYCPGEHDMVRKATAKEIKLLNASLCLYCTTFGLAAPTPHFGNKREMVLGYATFYFSYALAFPIQLPHSAPRKASWRHEPPFLSSWSRKVKNDRVVRHRL